MPICYNFILILELKEADTAKLSGKLDYKHADANHEDAPYWFISYYVRRFSFHGLSVRPGHGHMGFGAMPVVEGD